MADIVVPLGGNLMQVGTPLVTDQPDHPDHDANGEELFRRYDYFAGGGWVRTAKMGAQILEFKAPDKPQDK